MTPAEPEALLLPLAPVASNVPRKISRDFETDFASGVQRPHPEGGTITAPLLLTSRGELIPSPHLSSAASSGSVLSVASPCTANHCFDFRLSTDKPRDADIPLSPAPRGLSDTKGNSRRSHTSLPSCPPTAGATSSVPLLVKFEGDANATGRRLSGPNSKEPTDAASQQGRWHAAHCGLLVISAAVFVVLGAFAAGDIMLYNRYSDVEASVLFTAHFQDLTMKQLRNATFRSSFDIAFSSSILEAAATKQSAVVIDRIHWDGSSTANVRPDPTLNLAVDAKVKFFSPQSKGGPAGALLAYRFSKDLRRSSMDMFGPDFFKAYGTVRVDPESIKMEFPSDATTPPPPAGGASEPPAPPPSPGSPSQGGSMPPPPPVPPAPSPPTWLEPEQLIPAMRPWSSRPPPPAPPQPPAPASPAPPPPTPTTLPPIPTAYCKEFRTVVWQLTVGCKHRKREWEAAAAYVRGAVANFTGLKPSSGLDMDRLRVIKSRSSKAHVAGCGASAYRAATVKFEFILDTKSDAHRLASWISGSKPMGEGLLETSAVSVPGVAEHRRLLADAQLTGPAGDVPSPEKEPQSPLIRGLLEHNKELCGAESKDHLKIHHRLRCIEDRSV